MPWYDQCELFGGKSSGNYTKLNIEAKIPQSYCRNGNHDSECVTSAEFDDLIKSKYLTIMSNQNRFE